MGRKSRKKRLAKVAQEQIPKSGISHKKSEGPLDLLAPGSPGNKPTYLMRGWTWFWTGFVGVSTVLGVTTGILYFSPELSVETSPEPFPMERPSEGVFVLTNKGNFSVKHLRYYCRINRLKQANGFEFKWSDSSAHINKLPMLASRDRTAIACDPLNGHGTISMADITFFVKYKPAFWMLPMMQPFRFKTVRRNSDLLWLPEYTPEDTPYSESPSWLDSN